VYNHHHELIAAGDAISGVGFPDEADSTHDSIAVQEQYLDSDLDLL